MKVLGLPFMFRDRAHAFKVLDGELGQELFFEFASILSAWTRI